MTVVSLHTDIISFIVCVLATLFGQPKSKHTSVIARVFAVILLGVLAVFVKGEAYDRVSTTQHCNDYSNGGVLSQDSNTATETVLHIPLELESYMCHHALPSFS